MMLKNVRLENKKRTRIFAIVLALALLSSGADADGPFDAKFQNACSQGQGFHGNNIWQGIFYHTYKQFIIAVASWAT